MNYSIKIATPPAVEPVTSSDVKLHTRISHTAEDELINLWIKTGRELAEGFLRRALITQVIDVMFDGFPRAPFYLPRPPLASVSKISYYGVDNIEVALYNSETPVGTESWFLVDTNSQPARVDLAYGIFWPAAVLRAVNAFVVRYTAGYGAAGVNVPAAVRDAITLYCAYRYENRTAEIDAPPHFYALLRPLRVHL